MRLVDLSHPIESGMPVYPGSPPVGVEARETVETDGARVTDLTLETHAGTHVDAPAHTEATGDTVDELDASAFVFDARVVDCTGLDPREAIRIDDLDPGASSTASGGDCDLLVVHTGWEDEWGSDAYRDHPYLAVAAAEWCADRGYSVGLDTFGPDPTPSADPARESASESDGLPAHHALLSEGLCLVENLTGVGALPERVTLYAFPLPIGDGDASPVRAVAEPQ